MNNRSADTNTQKFFRWVAVLLALLFAWQVFDFFYTNQLVKTHHNFDRTSEGFDLVNPTVVNYQLPDIAKDLNKEVEVIFSNLRAEGHVDDVSYFVRDLDSGYGFGINENEKFIPASLLKIVTMISFYKISESNPSILQKELTYDGVNYNVGQLFKPQEEMVKGEAYTIEELLNRLISYSDNNAHLMLIREIDPKIYQETFFQLGLYYSNSPTEKTMSTKEYANIFRVLYNATFLSKENSQKALELLGQTNFDIGLQAGINGNVKLVNKFGERVVEENGKTAHYLHDCGIIYTKHPYVLCIFTKGEKAEDLRDLLTNVSRLVFKKMKY